MSAFSLHTRMKTPAPLVNCAVSDALFHAVPHVQQALFQFVNVVHTRLVDALLHDAPDLVVDRIEIGAVRWPQIRWNESRRRLFQKSDSVTRSMRGSTVLLKNEELSRH